MSTDEANTALHNQRYDLSGFLNKLGRRKIKSGQNEEREKKGG